MMGTQAGRPGRARASPPTGGTEPTANLNPGCGPGHSRGLSASAACQRRHWPAVIPARDSELPAGRGPRTPARGANPGRPPAAHSPGPAPAGKTMMALIMIFWPCRRRGADAALAGRSVTVTVTVGRPRQSRSRRVKSRSRSSHWNSESRGGCRRRPWQFNLT